MKKVTTILLIFIYALSSTGFALKADYCCNKLQSVKVVLADGVKDKEGCCKVKYQTFKVKDAHSAADAVNAPPLLFTFTHILSPALQLSNSTYIIDNRFASVHPPPLHPFTPVYIYNCVFRI